MKKHPLAIARDAKAAAHRAYQAAASRKTRARRTLWALQVTNVTVAKNSPLWAKAGVYPASRMIARYDSDTARTTIVSANSP